MEHLFSVTIHFTCHLFYRLPVRLPTYQCKVCSCEYPLTPSLTHIPSVPPAPPTNLITTPINATSTKLAWVPPSVQSPSLLFSYVVEVRNRSGVLVYRGTVTGPEVTIITLDPCDQYEATVASQYTNLTCTGNGSPNKPLGIGELCGYWHLWTLTHLYS